MSEDLIKEEGSISIHTENIFPIIKKWLYSDKDIFLRELVSNGVDAIHKLQNINLIQGKLWRYWALTWEWKPMVR